MIAGRAKERQILSELAASTRRGKGRLVLISGSAGIGKTNLLEWFESQWTADEGVVLGAKGAPLVGKEFPYLPWERAFESPRGCTDAGLLSGLAAVGNLLGHPSGRLKVASFWGDLVDVADSKPLLIALDDAQWFDASSLALLGAGLEEIPRAKVLVAAAFRPAADHSSRLSRLLPEWERLEMCHRLRLGALDDPAIAQLLQSVTDDKLREEIVVRAAGNPFFALSLLSGATSGHEVGLSESFVEFLLAQLHHAGPKVQQIIEFVALAGNELELQILTRALGGNEHKTESQVLAGVRQGVLKLRHEDGTVAVAHDLIAEAALHTLGPLGRREIHRALAAAYAEVGGGHGSALRAAQWWAAGEWASAFPAYVEAAREAETIGAYPEQWASLRRAISAADQLATTHQGPDARPLLPVAAEAAYRSGEAQSAVNLAKRFLEGTVSDEVAKVNVLERLVHYLRWTGDGRSALDTARQAAGLVAEQQVDNQTKFNVLATFASVLLVSGAHDEALKEALHVLEASKSIIGRPELTEVRANLLITAGVAKSLGGDTGGGLALLDEALLLARRTPGGEAELRALNNQSFVLQGEGRYEEAASSALEGILLARERHLDRSVNALLLANLVGCLETLGRWSEAMSHVDDGLAASAAPEVRASLLANAAHILAFRGETERARKAAADAAHEIVGLTAVGMQAQIAVAAADVELAAGSASGALSIAIQALSDRVESDDEVDILNLTVLGLMAFRAARHLLPEDSARKHRAFLTDQVVTAEGNADSQSHDRLRSAWVATSQAAAHAADGLSATSEWQAAASLWKDLNVPVWLIRCLIESAEADAHHDRPRATKRLSEAAQAAVKLDAPILIKEVQALAQRANLRLEGPPAAKQPPLPANLTPREHEVLIMVSNGATNRMIGRALFISERTAGVHVSNVLRKLGAKNRGEAAAIGYRLNLTN
ncbi:LuxR C-terminal-related transcriptional regulator [Arthrobacter sp. NPDC056691]|uniref:helix-turn-helix transcriptional regulator n=1 Tax=Arthrobacter sp. NPDC056691 TaxID=3345913 RepID=UPI0036713351